MGLLRITLKQVSFLVTFTNLILLSTSVYAHDGTTGAAKSKSTLSADIYEKEDTTVSFSSRPTLIRETDIIEVFFEGKNKGPYILKDGPSLGLFKERLIKSQKNKNQSVNIKINDDVITSVDLAEAKAAPSEEKKKSDLDSVLDDMLKK